MLSLKLQSHHLVLAHGSSSEAVLRYLESHPLQACILIDASDLYTAGERHGRAFHWSRINANCRNILFMATTGGADAGPLSVIGGAGTGADAGAGTGAGTGAGAGISQEAVRSLATFAAHVPNPLDCLREDDEEGEGDALGLGLGVGVGAGVGSVLGTRQLLGRVSAELKKICRRLP